MLLLLLLLLERCSLGAAVAAAPGKTPRRAKPLLLFVPRLLLLLPILPSTTGPDADTRRAETRAAAAIVGATTSLLDKPPAPGARALRMASLGASGRDAAAPLLASLYDIDAGMVASDWSPSPVGGRRGAPESCSSASSRSVSLWMYLVYVVFVSIDRANGLTDKSTPVVGGSLC